MSWWAWFLLLFGACSAGLVVIAVVDDRWRNRHPVDAAAMDRVHTDAELVERFDEQTHVREVPVGDLTWATTTGNVYLLDCDVEGCRVWFSPYADEDAAYAARDRHVEEHVDEVLQAEAGDDD